MKSYDVLYLFQNKLVLGKGSKECTDETRLPINCNGQNVMIDPLYLIILFSLLWQTLQRLNTKNLLRTFYLTEKLEMCSS